MGRNAMFRGHNAEETTEDGTNPSPVNRRRALKQMATSGAVIAGIGAATGSVSAQSSDDNSTSESSDVGIQATVNERCINRRYNPIVVTIDSRCDPNVYNEGGAYADYILDTTPQLDACRSQWTVAAEIDIHRHDNDPIIRLTCSPIEISDVKVSEVKTKYVDKSDESDNWYTVSN